MELDSLQAGLVQENGLNSRVQQLDVTKIISIEDMFREADEVEEYLRIEEGPPF